VWSFNSYAVTQFSVYNTCAEYVTNEVPGPVVGATRYTLLNVCCDPTQASNCNSMAQAVVDSLWFGMPGGPDIASLAGSTLQDAGPGPTTVVAPVSPARAAGSGAAGGSSASGSASADGSGSGKSSGGNAAIIGGAVGGAVAVVAVIGVVAWVVVRRRKQPQQVSAA
jgi:hypothetical protein